MKEIKLRARLSAYSKIESLQQVGGGIPVPDVGEPGNSIVVSPEGNYVPMSAVTETDIDKLFMDVKDPETVTKEQIDTLFENEPVDKPAVAVTFAEIDSLFK